MMMYKLLIGKDKRSTFPQSPQPILISLTFRKPVWRPDRGNSSTQHTFPKSHDDVGNAQPVCKKKVTVVCYIHLLLKLSK